jgi:hypothetical protein
VNQAYRRSVAVFAIVFIALGFAILVRTALAGGGAVGFTVGALFIALGTARLYLLQKQRGS